MGAYFTRLFDRIFSKKEVHILIFGLDAAGKTTILYRLKLGETVTTIPTIGFNVETVEYKNISFKFFDVGGGDMIRSQNRHYISDLNTQGIIFVVDSSDRERFQYAKEELNKMLSEDDLRDAILLVFANKMDHPEAMSVTEMTEELRLISDRNWTIQSSCATTGEGLHEGLDWLTSNFNQRDVENRKKEADKNSYLVRWWC